MKERLTWEGGYVSARSIEKRRHLATNDVLVGVLSRLHLAVHDALILSFSVDRMHFGDEILLSQHGCEDVLRVGNAKESTFK